MSTTIEWTQREGTTGETWNPVTGCTKVSAGCKHCYAKTVHDKRHKAYLAGKLQNIPQYAKPFEQVQLMPERLTLPLKWKKPRTVFVNSVSDLFHPDVPFSFIDQVFAVMALTPQHTYQILTKRPERMAEYLNRSPSHMATGERGWLEGINEAAMALIGSPVFPSARFGMIPGKKWPLQNVWPGVSVEDQKTADERIPHLLKCPAAVRFLSCEPLLGPVDLGDHICQDGGCGCSSCEEGYTDHSSSDFIHWVIVGGESGPKARPMYLSWARSLRDQCAEAGVPFFFKQWGEHAPHPYVEGGVLQSTGSTDLVMRTTVRVGKKKAGRLLDGQEHNAFPE